MRSAGTRFYFESRVDLYAPAKERIDARSVEEGLVEAVGTHSCRSRTGARNAGGARVGSTG